MATLRPGDGPAIVEITAVIRRTDGLTVSIESTPGSNPREVLRRISAMLDDCLVKEEK